LKLIDLEWLSKINSNRTLNTKNGFNDFFFMKLNKKIYMLYKID